MYGWTRNMPDFLQVRPKEDSLAVGSARRIRTFDDFAIFELEVPEEYESWHPALSTEYVIENNQPKAVQIYIRLYKDKATYLRILKS